MESPGYHFTSQLHLHKDCPDPASEGAGGDTSPQLRAEAKCWSSCELSALKGPQQTQQSTKETAISDKAGVRQRVCSAVGHTWLAVHRHNVHLECSYAHSQEWYFLRVKNLQTAQIPLSTKRHGQPGDTSRHP